MSERTVDTVVIGGGQAGLAVGYHLRHHHREIVILDAADEVGASWRRRWDSLRLFTPAGFSRLPGMAFPAPRAESPTKDAMADYLSAYADRFGLSVEIGTTVAAVHRDDAHLVVTATDGRRWRARDVVVATGAHGRPYVPGLAVDLAPDIVQLHSRDYRRPSRLPSGSVLVVGAANSGAEIALDLAHADGDRHTIHLAGRDVGHIPRLGSWTYPLMRRLGRPGSALARRGLRGGAEPLGRVRPGDVEAAGVHRLPRVIGVRNGAPVVEDGRVVPVDAVVWCTGSWPDHAFLDGLAVLDERGQLRHRHGVTDEPGLYVVGMPHQRSITSHLVGGVGVDAARIVEHLLSRPPG